MSIAITSQARSFKKIMPIIVAATVLLTVAGYFAVQTSHTTVSAARPGDFGLKEGDRITSYKNDGNPDIIVVNDNFLMAYGRVFLNPSICLLYGNQYGTGGCFAKGLQQVTGSIRSAFPISCYYTNGNTNDGKVYYLEVTGPDTGMLHHINLAGGGAEAVAGDPHFFLKVFKINNAEMNYYAMGAPITSMAALPACTTGQSTGPTPTPSAVGSINASLATGNPVSTTVTKNAVGVEFLRTHLAGTGIVSSITVKRIGAGSTDDFDNVYLYQGARRMTSGKSFQSSTGEVTFSNLNWSVAGSMDISFVADLSATAGNVDAFQVTGMVLANGTVSGLPVTGNNMSMSGADSGTITLNKIGSLSNPVVGAMGVEVSEFKLSPSTEDASVKRITMYQGGTVTPTNLTNLKIKTGAMEWPGTVDSKGYLVFDLGSGFTITKGSDAVFKVYADISGNAKKDETIKLFIEYSGDVYAVGAQYGFGMAATVSELDTTSEAHAITLQGGVLTIAYNGPSAANVGTDTNDTVFLRYSMTAASNIEIKATELTLCADTDASGVFDNTDAANVQANWGDLTDIKVTDEAAGGLGVIYGPLDGTAFTTADDDNASCGGTADGVQKSFTDSVLLMSGKVYSFKVTGDIKTTNGGFLDTGDAIKVVLDNYTDDMPSLTVMKYDGTNTPVAVADVVPQADIAGPVMTLQSSALTLGLSSAVNSQTFVRGTQGITAAGITFKASQASDMKVTDITLSGYFDEDNTPAFSLGSDGTTSVADLVSGVSLYEVETGNVIATTPSSNQLSNTTGTVTFNNLSWNIPAGATRTLGVKVNLGSNTLADTDYFAFDVNTTTDVTALDSSSKTVNAGNSDPNGATSPSTKVTVLDSGSMTVAVSTANTPSDHAVYWGQKGDIAGVWRFTATNEAQYLEKVQFGEYDSAGTQETDLATNAETVYLEYKNDAGQTLTASGTLSAAGTISFGFGACTPKPGCTDSRPYVPKDGNMDVTFKIDYKIAAQGATSGKTWDIDFIGDSGTGTDTFKAVGAGSGVVLQGNSTGITNQDQDTAGTDIMNYRVFPEFKLVNPSDTTFSTNNPVLSFTVTAKGLSDSRIFFDNTSTGSGSIKFEVVASGIGATSTDTFTVRDGNGMVVDTGTLTNGVLTNPHASLTVDFTVSDVEITGGTTKTYNIYLDSITNYNTPSAPGVGADYFQLVLRDDQNGLVNWVDNSNNTSTDVDTQSTITFLRYLPMAGYQWTAQ